jgi:taurine dioxygenase
LSGITIERVAGNIGAQITGIELGPDLPAGDLAELRAALLEHKVVFVRDQHHLDEATQAGFAERLGPLTTAHPTVPGLESEHRIFSVDSERGNIANSWHTDVTFVDRPPAFSVLRAVVLPPYGGDTTWGNTVTGYHSLTDELRELADKLHAWHTNNYDYAATHATLGDERIAQYREVFTSVNYETEHPVVRVHPETGERSLLLGHFVRRIAGLNGVDSDHVFNLLQNHVTRLENTVRWHWSLGDVAIWDNRATQHYAIADYGRAPRKLHRVTVAGDVPVGVDGFRSVARQGDSSDYLLAAAS